VPAEFRDQTLYFIVIDRFYDGDPQNNIGKDSATYDATHKEWYKYWGGDLLGIIKKLDYLRGMGISAVWITPVFDQVDTLVQLAVPMAPYHGYWAKDFKRIDEHLVEDPEHVRVFASNDTIFDRLLKEMHQRGMKLVLDVVCNHSSPTTVGARGELYDDGRKLATYDEDRGQWYHHAGEVTDWRNLDEIQGKSFAGLSDFNEASWAFRSYIKTAIQMWLDKGCDALRVDTVKHMPLWFWQEFSGDMRKYKPELFMFGEWFLGGVYDPDAVHFANHSGMSMLDFAMCFALQNSLARDRSLREIEDVVERDGTYHTATELVTFIDNHDLPRFLSLRNDLVRLRMAVDILMCARGIPCIYYGTEQGLHNDTNQGNDPYNRPMMESFDTDAEIYRDIAKLAQLRRDNLAVQKGGTVTRAISDDHYCFERSYMGHVCLVVINKGPARRLPLAHLELPDGVYENLLPCPGGSSKLTVSAGRAELELHRDTVQVYHHTLPALGGKTLVTVQVNGGKAQHPEAIYVTGDCQELGNWDLDRALRLERINGNTWSLDVPFNESVGQLVRYKYFIKDPSGRLRRETNLGHYHRVPASGRTNWRDIWDDIA